MINKRRLLIANDASSLGTGYGVYGRELLTRLYNTGKYEIAELSCYLSSEGAEELKKQVPWTIYPNAPSVTDSDEIKQAYHKTQINAFGSWRFDYVCAHFRPDIVFDMRDYWMYAYQETCVFRKHYKWVVMPTVDSAPQKGEWISTFQNMDLVIPYTDWARRTLKAQCKNSINMFPSIVNAGVDLDVFKPPENKKQLQAELFGREVEVTGCVMRNQKRKLIPDILKSYRAYLDKLLEEGKTEKFEKSILYIHTTFPEASGWNLPALLLEHNMIDKTYFTNICPHCHSVRITKFHEQPVTCKTCNKIGTMLPNAGRTIPTKNLVTIYQAFDLFLQVAICEGFGMPQAEAAACGIPIAATDYSAMSEIVANLEGYPIRVAALFRELETEANRANPDGQAITQIIYNYFALPEEERQEKSKRTRALCGQHYSWDACAEVWDRALSSVDISSNVPWDSPRSPYDSSVPIPTDLSPQELINFITKEIIKEPWLAETAGIKSMVKDCSNGYVIDRNHGARGVGMESIIKTLEKLLNHKANMEELRVNHQELDKMVSYYA